MRKAERTRVTAFVIHPGSPKSVPWDLDIPSVITSSSGVCMTP